MKINIHFAKRFLFLIVVVLFSINGNKNAIGQTIIYHEYYSTASDFMIVRWNIPKDSLKFVEEYVEEKIDKEGRVVQLQFLEKDKPLKSRLCYLPDIVKFEYPNDTTIIEYLLEADSAKMNAMDCQVAYKTVYTINKEYIITNAKFEYYIDTTFVHGGEPQTSENIAIELDFFRRNLVDSTVNADARSFVRWYSESYAKLNRHFPVSKEFSTYNWLDYKFEESKDIRKCLGKE